MARSRKVVEIATRLAAQGYVGEQLKDKVRTILMQEKRVYDQRAAVHKKRVDEATARMMAETMEDRRKLSAARSAARRIELFVIELETISAAVLDFTVGADAKVTPQGNTPPPDDGDEVVWTEDDDVESSDE